MDKTKKKIEALEKERKRELEEAKNSYSDQLRDVQGREHQKKGWIRNRKKDPTQDEKDIQEIKEYALVNLESLKEFIKYGANKVLDQIRVRSHANVIAREDIAKLKKKEGFDLKQGMFTFMIIIVVLAAAYTISMNFLNVNEVNNQLQNEKSSHGTTKGALAACQTELAAYKPNVPGQIKPAQSTSNEEPKVLEG